MLKGERDRLYHNTGKGTFTDVTIQAGDLDKDSYRGLGVAWGDINNDGYPDIVIANDAQPNLLYVNNRNGTFHDIALEAGIAVDEDGRERAGMGVDLADYDNDGWLDLAIANFYGEPHSLYSNHRNASFLETTWPSGIGRATMRHLGWGTRFIDYDNDGWKDLLLVNGHVYPEVDRHKLDETYAEPTLLLRNTGSGTFVDVTASVGAALAGPRSGRGLAVSDYDNDGDLDVLIASRQCLPVPAGEPRRQCEALADRSPCRPQEQSRWHRRARDRHCRRRLADGRSPQRRQLSLTVRSARALRLGETTSIESVDIRWPSGQVDRLADVPIDRTIVVREGDRTFTLAPGARPRRRPLRGDNPAMARRLLLICTAFFVAAEGIGARRTDARGPPSRGATVPASRPPAGRGNGIPQGGGSRPERR